jgi:hypothetical protein
MYTTATILGAGRKVSGDYPVSARALDDLAQPALQLGAAPAAGPGHLRAFL